MENTENTRFPTCEKVSGARNVKPSCNKKLLKSILRKISWNWKVSNVDPKLPS